MDADHEQKMNLSRREIRVLLLHDSAWVTKQPNQPTTYAARWVRMYSLFVRQNIGSIALRTVT
jgi:hypothetical protein